MYKFAMPLIQGEDPCTGCAMFGFETEVMFIFDPYRPECGRFQCDPTTLYGISKDEADQLVVLNKVLLEATEAAINASCEVVQDALGGLSGEVAGGFYSNDDNRRNFSKGVADYIQHELVMSGNSVI